MTMSTTKNICLASFLNCKLKLSLLLYFGDRRSMIHANFAIQTLNQLIFGNSNKFKPFIRKKRQYTDVKTFEQTANPAAYNAYALKGYNIIFGYF